MAKIGDAPFVHLWGSTLRELMDSYLMPPEGSYLHAFYHRYVDPPVLAKMRPPENEREFRTSMQEYIARNWNESLSLV